MSSPFDLIGEGFYRIPKRAYIRWYPGIAPAPTNSGINLTIFNEKKYKPTLHDAVKTNNKTLLLELIEKKMSPFIRDSLGLTPYDYAK
jgi:hypothetical protein